MIYYQGTLCTQFPLVFWQKMPNSISSLEELALIPNVILVVEPGSIQEKYALQFPTLTLKQLNNMSEIILDLKYGKSTAALLDPDIVPTLKQQVDDLVYVNITLPPAYQSFGNGIGIKKTNTVLIKEITTVVEELQKTGRISTFEKKWFAKKG